MFGGDHLPTYTCDKSVQRNAGRHEYLLRRIGVIRTKDNALKEQPKKQNDASPMDSDDFIAQMGEWYKNNASQFDMINVKEDVEDEYYEHQTEDFERFKDDTEIALFHTMGMGKSATVLAIAAYKFRNKSIDSLLIIAPNFVHKQWCVTGDAEVSYMLTKYQIKSTIADLYRHFNKVGKYQTRYYGEYKIRSLINNDYFDYTPIRAIHKIGIKQCIRIHTLEGYNLTLTPDHKVLTVEGWKEAQHLQLHEALITNGWPVCKRCGSSKHVATYNPDSPYYGHCRRCIKLIQNEHKENGSYIDDRGYRILYGEQTKGHRRTNNQCVAEHILIMEKYIGRRIQKGEHVHHINGDRQDNRLGNLQLLSSSEHAKVHNIFGSLDHSYQSKMKARIGIVDKIEWAGEHEVYDIVCDEPHNFVANKIVVHNCVEQIPKWLPRDIEREVQCFGGRGGAKETHPFYYPDYFHILVVNIDTFSTPKKWEQIAEWVKATKCMVILDEATSIKNIKSKRTERLLYEFNDVVRKRKQVVSSVPKTVARAILTGTPVTNGVLDLWSLFEFLRPSYFNRNYYSFRNHYAMLANITTAYGTTQILITPELWEGIKACEDYAKANAIFGVSLDTYNIIQLQDTFKGAYKHEEELKELIAPVSSFRSIEDCVDMPPQIYNKRQVTMSSEQSKAYNNMQQELLAMYGGATTTAANKLSALIRLSQISSGFIVQGQLALSEDGEVLDEYDVMPGESVWLGSSVPKLEALYRDLDETSHPCIIITRFTCEADRIYTELASKYSCLLYTGWKKTGTIEEFKEGKYEILVANIRCISRGFNLQNACQMFFYSNTFSLEDRLQTEGRIFRIGQQSSCIYTDYINEDTIDLKVVGALRQKRALLDYIRGTSLMAFVQEEDEVSMMEAV